MLEVYKIKCRPRQQKTQMAGQQILFVFKIKHNLHRCACIYRKKVLCINYQQKVLSLPLKCMLKYTDKLEKVI